MSIFTQFSGAARTPRTINLGNASSTDATSVLAAARAERQAREAQRLQTDAVIKIQRVWRGRRVAGRVRRQIISGLRRDGTDSSDVELAKLTGQNEARAMMVLFWSSAEDPWGWGKIAVLQQWCVNGLQVGQDGIYRFLQPLRSNGNYVFTLAFLLTRVLESIAVDAPQMQGQSCLALLDAALTKSSYNFLDNSADGAFSRISEKVLANDYVLHLVRGLCSLPANKKHPTLPPLIQLIVKPYSVPFLQAPTRQRIDASIMRDFLSLPSLPSSIPPTSLTHLCINLPFFTQLFPSALSTGIHLDERNATELLANLTTIIIRGGILNKQKGKEVVVWMRLLSAITTNFADQWGLWIESKGRYDGNDDRMGESSKQGLDARGVVSPALAKRLLPLIGADHLSLLANTVVRQSDATVPFCLAILSLLDVFRGSPRWEAILDILLTGNHAVRLMRDLWRGNVRGKWPTTSARQNWETLLQPNTTRTVTLTPPFLLLSTLFLQYLLTVPDDQFFSSVSTRSALSLDETLELSSIWRDLGFYGYWTGLAPSYVNQVDAATLADLTKRREDVRSLMTRGVVAICARDARRPFASEDFWIMTGEFDLPGFVEAVISEEQQLEFGADDEQQPEADQTRASLPPWMRGRRQISKRQMALISPRLGLLNNLPMTISFETRVEILNRFIINDHERLGIDRYIRRQGMRHRATIRRGKISEDGYRELDKLGPMLKGTIEIQFIDEWGQPEAGIDGGGLFKEFLTSLSTEAFDTDRGLWLATDRNELYPNPHSYAREPHQLNWYAFIGRVLGKALYEGILVDVSFAGFFLAKWLGRQSYLDDLASLDHELYKGLIALKDYPGDAEDLSLTFSIDEQEFGATQTVDLVPNGSNVPVTTSNKMEYIQLVCDYKLNKRIAPQCKAFFEGLSDIIDPKWLRMFDQQELQTLIGGTESPIDVDDLQKNTVMPDGEDDISLQLFWKVLRSMSQKELKALLKFVTSTPNPPLLGFRYLNPNFGIRLAGNDTTRLPSASSCANLLKLPRYKDEYTLRAKLLQAINSNAGFDLS